MLTEAEAKTKWCPKALNATDTINTFNRYENGEAAHNCLCIASACMAWRWAERIPAPKFFKSSDVRATSEPPRPDHVPASYAFVPYDDVEGDAAGWAEPEESCKARRLGYCGLAGQP